MPPPFRPLSGLRPTRPRVSSALLVLTALVAFAAPSARAELQVVDRIVAVVEDEIITASEVAEQVQLLLFDMQVDPAEATAMADSLREEVLAQLIESVLIVKEAERQGIELPAEYVEQQLEAQIAQQTARLGGPDEFERLMREEGLTMKELRTSYRREIRRRSLGQELIRAEVDQTASFTDAEVRSYFERHRGDFPSKPASVRLRHLVIQAKPTAETELATREALEAARERILAGADFCTVATDVSDDPSAARCGDLGFFAREDFADDAFVATAFGLADGELSDVVRSNYGFHLIQRLATDGDRIRCRHIVIPHATTDEDHARAKALVETVQARLDEGADFVELIRAYSDRPEGDGDVGYIAATDLFDHFREAVDGLMIGGVSDVVVDEQGYHIFQLLDRTTEARYELAEVEEQVRDVMRREIVGERYKEWVEELRERSYVELRPVDHG